MALSLIRRGVPLPLGDVTPPTCVLTTAAPDPVVTATFTVTATFSEDVFGFVVGDITVTNGAASGFIAASASVYTFTITPVTASLVITVQVGAGVCVDGAGLANTASNTISRDWEYLNTLLTAQNNLVYYKFDESSGNIIDYGSEEADGAVIGATQGEAGIAGVGSYLYDGVDDEVVIQNEEFPNVKNLTNQRYAALVFAISGAVDDGPLILFRNGLDDDNHELTFASTERLEANFITDGINARAITNNNQANVYDAWAWVFMDYDDSDSLSNGRRIRIFKGVGGTVTQLTLATDTAATGTLDTGFTQDMQLGAQGNLGRVLHGNMAAGTIKGGLWTADEMQDIVAATGV